MGIGFPMLRSVKLVAKPSHTVVELKLAIGGMNTSTACVMYALQSLVSVTVNVTE